MAQRTDQSSFTYEKMRNTARIFPIDYSGKEFSRLVKYDERTIRKALKDSCFSTVLQQLLYAPDGYTTSDSEDKDVVIPIPVEVAKFLEIYFQVAQESVEYRRILKNRAGVLEDTKWEFTEDLCKTLCHSILSASDESHQKVNDFYRRMLFRNDTFNRTVLEDIWDTCLFPKYQNLKKLAQQVPFEFQAQVLLDCLQQLDRAIYYLSMREQKLPSEDLKAEQALQDLLEELISGRVRQKSGSNTHAVYQVYNSQIDENTSLKDAFHKLNAPGKLDEELLSASRNAYLQHLTQMRSQTSMEKAYQNLQDYLSFSHQDLDIKILGSLVTKQCQQFCKQILDEVTPVPFMDGNTISIEGKRTYLTDLIDGTIREHTTSVFQTFALNFQETIQIIKYLNTSQDFFRQYQWKETFVLSVFPPNQLFQKDQCDSIFNCGRKYFLAFVNYLRNACNFLYPEELSILTPDAKTIISPNKLAERLSQDGLAAANFFDKVTLLENSSTSYQAKDILQCFNQCNDYLPDEQSYPPMEQVLQMIPNIMTGLFLQILKKVFEDTVPEIIDEAINFYKFLKTI